MADQTLHDDRAGTIDALRELASLLEQYPSLPAPTVISAYADPERAREQLTLAATIGLDGVEERDGGSTAYIRGVLGGSLVVSWWANKTDLGAAPVPSYEPIIEPTTDGAVV